MKKMEAAMMAGGAEEMKTKSKDSDLNSDIEADENNNPPKAPSDLSSDGEDEQPLKTGKDEKSDAMSDDDMDKQLQDSDDDDDDKPPPAAPSDVDSDI